MAARAAVGGRPGERVILRTILPLLLFGVISRSPVEDPEVSSVLGATRFDALYLFPMHLRHTSAQLLVDFAKNRSGFVLGEFPLEPVDDGLPTDPPSGPRPPPDAFGRLVERELPAFVGGS